MIYYFEGQFTFTKGKASPVMYTKRESRSLYCCLALKTKTTLWLMSVNIFLID